MAKQSGPKINPPVIPGTKDFPRYDLAIAFTTYLILTLIFYRNILSASVMVFGTDWLAAGYPIHEFIQESLRQSGQIPQWISHLYGGVPLFANAGDTYFPFTILLRSLFPVHQYFAYLYILNTLVGGLFTYLFLKNLKLTFWPSFIGGLGYMFTGILVSYTYGGHEGRMAIVAFLPVVMYLIDLALERKTLASFLLAGLGLGFSLLIPHVQMNYYLLILVFLYFVFKLWQMMSQTKSWARIAKLSVYFALFLVAGFLISAVLYLPFSKYVPFSPRGGEEGRGYEFATSWAMNPEETINLAVPDFSGSSVGEGTYWGRNSFKLHSEYMGATVTFLSLLGLFFGRKNKLVLFFLVMIVLAFTVAWGGHTPIYKLYYNLVPGFKKFRAPSLVFFLVAFSMVVLSAFGLQYVIEQAKQRQNSKSLSKFIVFFLGAVVILVFFVSIGSSAVKSGLSGLVSNQPDKLAALEANFPKFIAGMWKYVLFTLVVGGVLLAVIRQKIKLLMAGIILSLVAVIDLWLVESKFVQTVPPPEVYFAADEVASRLKQDQSLFRVFPLQYRNDNYLMLFNLQNLAGEHGNQLQRYNEFLGAGKKSMVDYHNIMSNINFLRLSNAKYVVTRQPIAVPGFKEIQKGNFFIYENTSVVPRAFIVPKFETITEAGKILDRIAHPDFNPARSVILEKEPYLSGIPDSVRYNLTITEYDAMNVKIGAEVDQPGFLVFLDNYYPDWKAYLDGKETQVYRADYTFRAVQLEPGKHQVEFIFEPKYYYLGKKISLFSLVGVLAAIAGNVFFRRTMKKKSQSGGA